MKKAAIVSLRNLSATLALSAVLAAPAMMSLRAMAQQVQLDPAEYADYQTAEKVTDKAAQAPALEGYLAKYPKSPIKASVLREIMLDYANTNNAPKAEAAAEQLLQLMPNDLQAEGIDALLRNGQAQAATDPATRQQMLDAAADYAQKALNTPKAEGQSDADYKALHDFFAGKLYSIVGNDDFAKKDYPGAIAAFKAELAATPIAETQAPGQALQDTYYLGSAYYSSTPSDLVNCTFYTTRAASYAPAAFQAQMQPLATYCYKKYHGGADGYDAVQAAAKAGINPPDGFTIKAAPTPAEQATALLASTAPGDLATMAPDDRENIIENGTQEQADKVFDAVKGKPTELPDAIVIAATADQLQVAVGQDSVQAKKADFTFNMKTPLTKVPAVGDKVTLIGTYQSYTKSPIMFVMSDASIPGKAPAKKPTTTRRR